MLLTFLSLTCNAHLLDETFITPFHESLLPCLSDICHITNRLVIVIHMYAQLSFPQCFRILKPKDLGVSLICSHPMKRIRDESLEMEFDSVQEI